MKSAKENSIYQDYNLRVLLSVACTLLLVIGLVRFWPAPTPVDPSDVISDMRDGEVIIAEEIQPTRQAPPRRPPPPVPAPPIPVPYDVVLPEDFLELHVYTPEADDGDAPPSEGEGVPSFVERAEVGPRPVRFVEPEYSHEARRNRVRARIEIEVRIDQEGHVVATRILERFLLEGNDQPPTPVAELGYGLEEAAVSAAERWRFRPARHNGEPVGTHTTLTFSFGV